MSLVKSDGNGGLTIPKWFLAVLTLAVFIAGFGVAWGTQAQMVSDHLCNPEIHVAHSALKDEFASNSDMRRIEDKLDDALAGISELKASVARIEGDQ